MHYVPIQVAYSDLYDALAFFRVHDDAAAKIAAAGKKWSQQFWRKEDMSAYLYRSVELLSIAVFTFEYSTSDYSSSMLV